MSREATHVAPGRWGHLLPSDADTFISSASAAGQLLLSTLAPSLDLEGEQNLDLWPHKRWGQNCPRGGSVLLSWKHSTKGPKDVAGDCHVCHQAGLVEQEQGSWREARGGLCK